MKIFLLAILLLSQQFSIAQNLEDCEPWYEIISYPISQLSSYKVIQKNEKYGFRLIKTEDNDTCYGGCYFLLDTRLDSAYLLTATFFDYPEDSSDDKNEWNVRTSIFSPDGKYTALKFFHFGGIPIVKTNKLRLYLKKKAPPQFCIDQYKPGYGPSPIHRVIGWKNNTKLIYGWGCCGTSFTGEYDIMKRKTKQLGEVNSWKDNEE